MEVNGGVVQNGINPQEGRELVLLGAVEVLVADPSYAMAVLNLAEEWQVPKAFKAQHDQEELIPI